MVDEGEQSATVIALSGRKNSARFAVLAEVEAYWHGLRRGQEIPYRADLDPRGLERALENTFILERIGPGVARFRLAGRHLCDLMGMEVRGMPLTAMFAPGSREAISTVLEALFTTPATERLSVGAPEDVGCPALSGEMCLLPLRSGTGDVARALGCLATDGRIGKAPRRLELIDETVRPLAGAETPPPQVDPGFAETQSPFRPAPPRGRPALWVVKSDERSDEG